ncbi:MAG: hypothetical protein M3214_06870 [Actinomycetota bacterium]|nr:hypothetical protein [Actinomycetota bacterium]
MNFAHTLGAGGPDLELFLFAAALLVLGVVLFLQKSAKPVVSVVLVIAAFAVGTGAFAFGGSSSSTSSSGTVAAPDGVDVQITTPDDGSSVPAGRPLTVEANIIGGSLTAANESDDPTQGHLHVFVDDQLISMPTRPTQEIELEGGDHTIVVEFTTADHKSFEPRILDSIEVTAER